MASKSKINKSYKFIQDDWTLTNVKEFIDVLLEVTKCNDVRELKNLKIIKCIWEKVGQKLDTDHMLLRNFWYHRLHMQLFCPEPIYSVDVRIKLIEYLYGKGFTDSRDIKWLSVLSCFDGYTALYLYRVFTHLLEIAKIRTGSGELKEQIPYLYNTYMLNLIEAYPEDNFLPRLVYKNGVLEHNAEDLEIISNERSNANKTK